MQRLAGRVALITGAGRGIGRAVALKLARDGARVVVNDMDEEPADDVVGAIRELGGEAIACVGNVTDTDFGDRFVGAALDRFGGLDIIVNNAGFTLDGVVQKMADGDFQTMLDLHVTAPFRIFRAASEPIRLFAKREAKEGREIFRKLVLVSSIAGTNGNAGQIGYSSAKSALIGMTKTLSKEWGRYKVCANCVAFGLIETRLTKSHDDPASRVVIDGREIQSGIPAPILAKATSSIPLGRAGSADEAAGGVYLFCIPESDYVTGQVVTVSGGMN
ncbi:MAG TPA: SDR family NAD(P)-dependent oxidoreductase [Sphingopyxis sp.]|nr:SDR family NAD(P)-dependent oxidoreductase [Sphingopyxis sp.]